MEYEIYDRGRPCGTVRLDPEGLYYRLSGNCAEPGPGIWRLWACFGAESRLVGVCSPQAEGLQLEKRFSRNSWPELPDSFVLGREREGFRPWRGVLEQREVPDGMLRQEADGSRTLAIFPPPGGPVPLAEFVGLMRESELDGRECLLLSLTEGLPELPEPTEAIGQTGQPEQMQAAEQAEAAAMQSAGEIASQSDAI